MLGSTNLVRNIVTLAQRLFCAFLVGLLAGIAQPLSTTANQPKVSMVSGNNGLFEQPWFHESFLELKEDFEEARSAGKGLIVIFEQAGCPYCREMHRVNFADADIAAFLQRHYVVVQLDLRGSREATDFDGKAMEERALARRWGVVFTPTLLIFSSKTKIDATKSGGKQATAVMPGYFKPFHFRTMLEYVSAGHYGKKNFQDYVNERARKLRSEGKRVKIW